MFAQTVEISGESLSALGCGHFHESRIAGVKKANLPDRKTRFKIRDCITKCPYYGHLGCSHPQARNNEGFVSDRDKLLASIDGSKLDISPSRFL